MNSREIINAIVRDKTCPERMGLFEHWWEDTLKAWETEHDFPRDIDPSDHFGFDIRPFDDGFNNTQAIVDQRETIDEDDETIVTKNGWGATLRHWKHKSGTPEHINFELTNENIWREKYRPHLLNFDPHRFDDFDVIRENYRRRMSEDKWVCFMNILPVEIMRASMGDIVMLESLYTNPAWIHDFCDVVTSMLMTHYEHLFREVGLPDGMFLYEDMGYTYGPIMSPELQRANIFPHHKRIVDFFHSYDIPVIMHSCGKIRPFLQAIFDTGIDCLQVLEAKAGQHVAEFSDFVGNKLAFMGNMNIVAYETNNRSELEKEIIPKLELIKEKRIPYVFHSDHSIPRSVWPETYEYSLELFRKYGRY